MSGWLNRLTRGGLLLLLVVAICLGGYSSLLSHKLELARQQVAEQKKTLAQQAEDELTASGWVPECLLPVAEDTTTLQGADNTPPPNRQGAAALRGGRKQR